MNKSEIIGMLTHYYELDLDNCEMSHESWINVVSEALTNPDYLEELKKEYAEYLSAREIIEHTKSFKALQLPQDVREAYELQLQAVVDLEDKVSSELDHNQVEHYNNCYDEVMLALGNAPDGSYSELIFEKGVCWSEEQVSEYLVESMKELTEILFKI